MISKRAFVSALVSLPFAGLFAKKAQTGMLSLAADFKVVEYDGVMLTSMSHEDVWYANALAQDAEITKSQVEFFETLAKQFSHC